MIKEHKRVVWQNYDFDLKDWADFLKEEYPEVEDENKQYELVMDLNDLYLNDERSNLDIKLDDDILVIADIGLWNGRRYGYKEIHSNNLADCLQFQPSCDYAEWYVDSYGNLRSRQTHHDGTHYLLYRYWKPNATDSQRGLLLNKLYFGTVNPSDITRYTASCGKVVRQIYGF